MNKGFSELTRLGKIRRLHDVVDQALQEYDIDVEQVKFLTIETNTLFEIRSKRGERFAMRIYTDGETTLKENQAEIFWLTALVQDTDLKVTQPVPRKDGDYISEVTVPGVPPDRRCVIYRWIPGQVLGDRNNLKYYYKLGQVLAKLHNHAKTLNPLPPTINPKRWDKAFYYPDEPVVYNTQEYSHVFSQKDIQLIDSVIAIMDKMFNKLFSDQEDLMLIHGDLHFWNVHAYQGELYLIDFEDINLGYPVQDIAVTLYAGRNREDFSKLKKTFINGYTEIRKWPKVESDVIPTLMAARTVMFINYAARILDEPKEYIKSRLKELKIFLAQNRENP